MPLVGHARLRSGSGGWTQPPTEGYDRWDMAGVPKSVEARTLLERLGTPAGAEALAELDPKLRPSVPADGHDLEFILGSVEHLPEDRFERDLLCRLRADVVTPQQLGRKLPGAVAQALLEQAEGGQVRRADVARGLGPAGVRFYDRLATAAESRARDPLTDRLLLEGSDPAAVARALEQSGVAVPSMPAVEYLEKHLARPDEFRGFAGLGLQHLFLSTAGLFESLGRVGLELGRTTALGKVYSTNHLAAAYLEHRGVRIDPTSYGTAGGPYEAEMKTAIRRRLRDLIEALPTPPEPNPTPQVLLLDDGGEAIVTLHEEFPEYAPYFVCVEQTRRGAKALEGVELRCPVANVAESWAKLTHESPMIGHSVVLEVGRKLDELEGYGVDTGKDALVVGFGSVGAEVARSLAERGMTVRVHDPDPDKRAAATQAGFEAFVDLTDVLPQARVLVSCAGRRTLSDQDYDLLPDGAMLVNAASNQDELGGRELGMQATPQHIDPRGRVWKKLGGVPFCAGLGVAEAHRDQVVRRPSGKRLLKVHDGYVVNMTGEQDPIPARYIQLTRALLFAGAVAARRAEKPGLVDIPMGWQKAIVKVVDHQLAKTSESLMRPRWEKVDGYPSPFILEVPEEARALEDEEAMLAYLPPIHRSAGGEQVFGYRLGPTEPGTREAWVDEVRGNRDGQLQLAEAALDRAVLAVSRHLGIDVEASARGESPILDLGRAAEPMAAGRLPSSGDERRDFARVFGAYLHHLCREALSAIEGQAPSDSKLSRALDDLLTHSSIPRAWVQEGFPPSASDGKPGRLS